MDAAVLVLLASGVGFGWQPMPDGSPGYEYLVQLEPEVAATLADGQSIPISVEVPEEIRPIRRIRIVVGRGNLPRHTLTTRMKPFAEASRPQRYGSSTSGPQTVPPVRSNPLRYPQAAVDSFGRTLQQSAQQAQNSVQGAVQGAVQQGQVWAQQNGAAPLNNGLQQAGQQVRAGVQQLFGNTGGQQAAPGTAGNRSILQNAQNQAGSLIQNAQNGIQQGFDPLRQTIQQTGDQLRGAAQRVGQQAQQTVDRFGRPLQRSILNTNPTQTAGQATAPAFGNQPNQNLSQPITTAQDRTQRLDQPIGRQQQTNDWQATSTQRNGTLRSGADGWTDNRQPATTQPAYRNQQNRNQQTTTPTWAGGTPSGGTARYRYPSAEDRRWTWPPVLSRTANNDSRYNPANTQASGDPFDIANRQTGFQQPPQADYRQTQPPPANSGADSWAGNPWTSDGPTFPNTSQPTTPDPFVTQDRRPYAQSNPAASPWPDSGSQREINSGMLNRSADSQLDPLTGQPATFVTNDRPATTPGTRLGASDFGWDGRDLSVNGEAPREGDRSLPTGTKGVFPLILSWVLLSGSGAGNMYLFWSYLDVRNKYRGLVRSAAKKFGGRFIDLDD